LIRVLEGGLRFRVLSADSEPPTDRLLSAGEGMVVAPEEPHEVGPDGPVRFFVEFYRAAAPDAGN
jgi:tellurite methyltransferase